MSNDLDLNTKNAATVMLVQALCGAISPNFRIIALEFSENIWKILFVSEKESSADREEIEDVTDEFGSLLLGLNIRKEIRLKVEILIDASPRISLDHIQWITVFRRKENLNNLRPCQYSAGI